MKLLKPEKLKKYHDKKTRHHIERQYKRDLSPTDFDTENTNLAKKYLEPDVRQV